MGWCDCLEHFYGWVWVGVTGCGWVGKMVKPILMGLKRLSCFKENATCAFFEKVHKRNQQITEKKHVKILAKEKHISLR